MEILNCKIEIIKELKEKKLFFFLHFSVGDFLQED